MTKSARVQLRTQSPFSEIHFFCKSLHQHTSAVHQWTAQCISTQVHWHTSAVQQFSVVQKCINTLLCIQCILCISASMHPLNLLNLTTILNQILWIHSTGFHTSVQHCTALHWTDEEFTRNSNSLLLLVTI